MKKAKGKKVKKAVASVSKKVAGKAKKVSKVVKKKSKNIKSQARRLMSATKTATKKAKAKLHATEDEILGYVKENPVKSLSAAALVGLIAGFLTHLKK